MLMNCALCQVVSVPIIVPTSYNHSKQLIAFERRSGEFSLFDHGALDSCREGEVDELRPGERLVAEFFKLTDLVAAEELMDILRSGKYLLAGVRGLSLVYEQAKTVIPERCRFFSFDRQGPEFGRGGRARAQAYLGLRMYATTQFELALGHCDLGMTAGADGLLLLRRF